MSDQPDAVMREWFDEVWNQGRGDSINRLFAANATAHGLPGGPMRGPRAFGRSSSRFAACSDIRIVVEHTVTEGDRVAVHCRVTGTHTGDTLGIPPTGKSVDFQGVTIARVVDGQINEGWNCFDFLTDAAARRRPGPAGA